LLVYTFQPAGMLDEALQRDEVSVQFDDTAEIVASNLDLRETDEGDVIFTGNPSFRTPLGALSRSLVTRRAVRIGWLRRSPDSRER
jgi:hypothetical protein